MNLFRYDQVLDDDQAELNAYLPEAARAGLQRLQTTPGAPTHYRLFHPFQQMILIHAAARYAKGRTDSNLTEKERLARWALASIQVNDHLQKEDPDRAGMTPAKRGIYLFSEGGSQWDLLNPSRPNVALARTRAMMVELPRLHPEYAAAAAELRAMFTDRLGLDFDIAYNLTAFAIYWWEGRRKSVVADPDASIINRGTWLAGGSTPREALERYVEKVAFGMDDIVAAFDKAGGETTLFRNVLPFRARPLLTLGRDGLAYLSPQFLAEKGGVNLFWLLAADPGGLPQERHWNDAHSRLFEGYVRFLFEQLTPSVLGGQFVPNLTWSGPPAGELDGVIVAGKTLVLVETKASLVNQVTLARGSVEDVEAELRKKFVLGEGTEAKGLRQIANAIDWLSRERSQGREVARVGSLRGITRIIPVLIVADRALQHPGLAAWFHREMKHLLRPAWCQIDGVIVCVIDDLEGVEGRALAGHGSVFSAFDRYAGGHGGTMPFHRTYERRPGEHPRLGPIIDAWMQELHDRRILPP